MLPKSHASSRRRARPNPIAGLIVFLAATCLVAIASTAPSTDTSSPGTPVLVELFTSEGCSSCPPAEAVVQGMDSQQPVPGARLIVLSEHVDYFDHEGWKDPYSSHSLTERQTDYVRNLRLGEPSTPQIIIDGSTVMLGDSEQIQKELADAATAPKVTVRIGSVLVDPASLHAHIEVGGATDKHAQIFAALALDHAESHVLRGENAGKLLTHVAVVEYIKKVGDLGKGRDFSQDVQLKLKAGMDPKNLRLVVFVQEPGPGRVLGAAERRTGD